MGSNNTRGSLSALILAAGSNTRLNGVVPTGLKPLMVVNGRPLVMHAVNHAQEWEVRFDHMTFVVSPSNAEHILQLTPERSHYVVQPRPTNIIDAIRRGLQTITSEWMLILCADNIFSPLDEYVLKEFWKSPCPAVGVRILPDPDGRRFTRFKPRPLGEAGIEGLERVTTDEPIAFTEDDSREGSHLCWIGPLILNTQEVHRSIELSANIGQLIDATTNVGRNLRPIMMRCEDFGIPEMLV